MCAVGPNTAVAVKPRGISPGKTTVGADLGGELRKGIRLKFLNRDAAANGNVRESRDIGGGLGLETAQPEARSSGRKSIARCVVSGVPPTALENPED
ncbi:hypothetical protein V6N13_101150 [Hibiscus sabdariffa]